MKGILKSLTCVMLLGAFFLTAFACSPEDRGPGDTVDANYEWATADNWNNVNVLDSSEISDYTGSHEIELVAWNTEGTGNFPIYNSSDDIVSKEIKRITGISIDKNNSFDNKGSTADVRFGNLLTTGNLPDIAYGSGWMDTEEVWDLTELIDEYCPTIKARMPEFVWNNSEVNGGQEGKVYGIPYSLGNISLSTLDPAADPSKTIMFSFNEELCPFVYVREDILLEAYPDALSVDDINRIYQENGGFTEEQVFDIEINSAEEFRTEFLPKIAQAIEDGGDKYRIGQRTVTPMLVTAGSDRDTWDFMGKLIPGLLGAGANSMNSNFSYWDKTTQKIESMLYQDFYKNEVYEWAKMINEGTIVSDTMMNTNNQQIAADYNSGYYAIGYLSGSMATGNVCTWKGEQVRFRKVYINVPAANERFEYMGSGEAAVSSVKFLKSEVREDELPQLLRWLDFQCSRTADKLYAWGPKTAGLFNEDANGVRTYKDEELADQMVYNAVAMGALVQKYNLANGSGSTASPIFPFAYGAGSIYHPKCTYDLSSLSDLANSYFSASIVLKDKAKDFVGLKIRPSFHTWKNTDLDGVETIWASRDLVEGDLKQLLLAGASQSTFDKAWDNLQSTLNSKGWTKQYFNGKVTNAFLSINEDYLDSFYQGE